MQLPPVNLLDVSLLLALEAMVLLITAELASPHYGQTNLIINKRKLRTAARDLVILFLITVAIHVVNIIITF
jgi:hypothetical protein